MIKNRFDQLSQSSLYADINLFNGKVQRQAKFCVAGIDPDKWELFVNKKYVDIDDERKNLTEDVGRFFQNKLKLSVTGAVLGDLGGNSVKWH